MVTKYVEFGIICDICGLDGCGISMYYWYKGGEKYLTHDEQIKYLEAYMKPSHSGIRNIRKKAKKFGWLHKNGKDICPLCQKNDQHTHNMENRTQ